MAVVDAWVQVVLSLTVEASREQKHQVAVAREVVSSDDLVDEEVLAALVDRHGRVVVGHRTEHEQR